MLARFESDVLLPLHADGLLHPSGARGGGGAQGQRAAAAEDRAAKRGQWMDVYVSLVEGSSRVLSRFAEAIATFAPDPAAAVGRIVHFHATAFSTAPSEAVAVAGARALGTALTELGRFPGLLLTTDFEAAWMSIHAAGERAASEGEGFALPVLKSIVDFFADAITALTRGPEGEPMVTGRRVPSQSTGAAAGVLTIGSEAQRRARVTYALERALSFAEAALRSDAVCNTFMFPCSVQNVVLLFLERLALLLAARTTILDAVSAAAASRRGADVDDNDDDPAVLAALQECAAHAPALTTLLDATKVAAVWDSLIAILTAALPPADAVRAAVDTALQRADAAAPGGNQQHIVKAFGRASHPLFLYRVVVTLSRVWPLVPPALRPHHIGRILHAVSPLLHVGALGDTAPQGLALAAGAAQLVIALAAQEDSYLAPLHSAAATSWSIDRIDQQANGSAASSPGSPNGPSTTDVGSDVANRSRSSRTLLVGGGPVSVLTLHNWMLRPRRTAATSGAPSAGAASGTRARADEIRRAIATYFTPVALHCLDAMLGLSAQPPRLPGVSVASLTAAVSDVYLLVIAVLRGVAAAAVADANGTPLHAEALTAVLQVLVVPASATLPASAVAAPVAEAASAALFDVWAQLDATTATQQQQPLVDLIEGSVIDRARRILALDSTSSDATAAAIAAMLDGLMSVSDDTPNAPLSQSRERVLRAVAGNALELLAAPVPPPLSVRVAVVRVARRVLS
jgi:hypothetical protein